MNWLVYHIVSGHAFFIGTFLMIVAAFASTQSRSVFRRLSVLTFLVGSIAVVVSSTAIPYWFYVVAGVITLAWVVSLLRKKPRRWAPRSMAAVWLIVALVEVPYHITPSLAPTSDRSMAIIGDSVTAGIGGDETSETWPTILAREQDLHVQDISHVGETAASALKRASSHEITASVVIVEVGGNDILGSTKSAQFEQDLNALFRHLAGPDRQVIMFELPLPPFSHEFGRIQRAAAVKHNVLLIPKRVFLSVIAGSGSTLDTIHLSQAGHQLMAETVWGIAQSAFAANQHR